MKKIASICILILIAFAFMPWSVFADEIEADAADSRPSVADQDLPEIIKAAADGEYIFVSYDNENGIADKTFFEALAGTDKTVVFDSGDYKWYINGTDISNTSKSVDLKATVSMDDASSYGMEPAPVIAIDFPENGTLPGRMEFRFQTNDFVPSDDSEIYFVTEDGLKQDDTRVTLYKAEEDEVTSCIVSMSHNSRFLISEKALHKAVDTTGAVTVNSTQEAIDALKKARAEHLETVVIRANPEKVKIERDDDRADLHPSIYREFDYSVTGGLYDFLNYDVFSGPGCMEKMTDPADSSYTYYKVEFVYHDNSEELAAADSKLKQILKECEDKSDGDKIVYLCNWMKKNIAEGKDSSSGYPRNCNGLYGCLFGDGTGFCCSTYACTVQRFCELAGIEAKMVAGGEGEENHGFNIMKIGSQWYLTDYTWGEVLRGRDYFKNNNTYNSFIKKYAPSYTFADKDYKSGPSSDTTSCSHSKIIVVPAKAAKCNETGYKKHWKCESCGQLFKDSKGKKKTTEKALIVKTKAHKFKKKITTDEYLKTPATCIKKATYYYACTMCGAKGKKTYTGGSLLPHDCTKIEKVEATCQKNGVKEHYKCSICKKLYTSPTAKKATTAKKLKIKKLKHKFTEKDTDDKYKAKKAGMYYYSCEMCGAKGKKTFKAELPAE